ncbi:MAG: hypothetical protein E6H00_12935 [Bacillati bacterium ANGP1]|uniref:Uncharacterized protein n=1 Tax=Candidatus Segetimicrobium genomatis TaxID=2569760 RepID=A0A537JYJ3_9BACT|nr:MAG: hypothetical protein E6H00_12935 [Terrabacteria group bacterium ANGP1]
MIPVPPPPPDAAHFLPAWVVLLILLMATAVTVYAVTSYAIREQKAFKESARRLAGKMVAEYEEQERALARERERLIDQAGRKPWQRN